MGKRIDLKVHLPEWITRMFPEAIWLLPTGRKTLYLTFDDGPVPEVTPQVLDILHEKGIKGTFFCVGENVSRYPELYARIIKEGHGIGNHTHNHLQGIKCNSKRYLENIEKAGVYIKSNLFRPPHGWIKKSQYRAILGRYIIVMWDVISCDYDSSISPQQCFNNVAGFVRDGSIITFHDSIKAKKNVLATLPLIIDELFERGYQFEKIEFPNILPINQNQPLNKMQTMRKSIFKILRGAS
jgi:peptidoglycan-N-acetylglucosamine deacetylase